MMLISDQGGLDVATDQQLDEADAEEVETLLPQLVAHLHEGVQRDLALFGGALGTDDVGEGAEGLESPGIPEPDRGEDGRRDGLNNRQSEGVNDTWFEIRMQIIQCLTLCRKRDRRGEPEETDGSRQQSTHNFIILVTPITDGDHHCLPLIMHPRHKDLSLPRSHDLSRMERWDFNLLRLPLQHHIIGRGDG